MLRSVQCCRYLYLGAPRHFPRLRTFPLEKIEALPTSGSGNENDFEVHHPTVFGSIRLDSRNLPKRSKDRGPTKSFSSESPLESASSIRTRHAPESIYMEEDDIVELPRNGKDSESSIIDEQYFATLPSNLSSHNEPSIDCSESLRETRELMRDSTQGLNFIDQQLFPVEKPSVTKEKKKTSSSPPSLKKEKKPTSIPQKTQETALDFMQNKIGLLSPGETYEDASLITKERLVKDIGLSLQKRLTAVHDHYYNAPPSPEESPSQPQKENQNALPSQKCLKKAFQARNLEELTEKEMENILKKSIIFNKDGVVALNKPYGLSMRTCPKSNHSVAKYLPALSEHLETPTLKIVHRLDKTTTGVLLLAASDEDHSRLADYFRNRMITKIYWALSNGVPEPSEGIIDIPLRMEKVAGRCRAMLVPKVRNPLKARRRAFTAQPAKPAVTEFKTLKTNYNISFLEMNALTGYKHQIRAHLGFGLSTPILGDHKFSHVREVGKPQKVNGECLQRLKVRSSKARKLPICLHAREILLPSKSSGELRIVAGLPHHFTAIKSRLGL